MFDNAFHSRGLVYRCGPRPVADHPRQSAQRHDGACRDPDEESHPNEVEGRRESHNYEPDPCNEQR